MISGKKILGLITARGGSKGIPGKNLIDIGGKPLIAWTIEVARKSKYIDRLVLSSDSADIISVADELGCEAPFVRPAELADDHSSSADVVMHALDQLPESFDYFVLLQPTSPFRITSDIDACLSLCLEKDVATAVSVSLVDKSPAWMYKLASDSSMKPILPTPSDATRRQDLEEVHVLNGAVFVARTDSYRQSKSFLGPDTVGLEMPAMRSIDIDTPFDVAIANAICGTMNRGT
jgi:CMP-N,N'-diacetyllegionaminic acid synthase